MTIMDHTGAVIILDASGDLAGGDVTYEGTPSGSGAAQLTIGMLYEQVIAAGYYTARNLVEISSGDDCVQTSFAAGATKIYVGSKTGYDTSAGHDAGQIAIFDGATLCMRIPVTGVGTDAGGDYITVGAPLAGGGNFTTLPAYGAGAFIYRRRYCGIIMGRHLQSSRDPTTVITCAGLQQRLSEAVCTFALNTTTIDMGSAIFTLLNDFASQWPSLTIASGNFPATGQTSFDGSYDRTQVSRVLADLLSAAGSAGNNWVIRVGHDRTPRLLNLYTLTGNTYTYNVTLQQGASYFEARSFTNSDQDASQLYNTIEVIGDTDPVTNNPVRAIVQDTTSIVDYGEIDAQPVTNTACKTVAQCSLYGQSLLNQQSAPRSNAEVTVATRNDVYVAGAPMGLSRGDVILGVHCVTVTEISPAPNVYGIVSSVVTTVQPGGDTYQVARFAAIEPDWSDVVAERANALASAVRQNTTTAANASGQYFVDTSAFGYTIAGLVVTTPLFGAIFGPNTSAVGCGGNTFSLVASTTNWVWLNPDATWTVQQTPTQVAGAILYAIFTCSATTVLGSINKASTGIVYLPVTALPSMGNQAAPNLTNVSAVSYPVVGNGSYDAQVSFTVDVASANWLVGLALFAVPTGSTQDPHFFPKGTVSSYGVVSGEYVAIWKHIGAGNSEDLYVAYEDGQGRFSPARFVATTATNPAGTSAFGSIGTAAPNPLQVAGPFAYVHNGGGTYDADFTVYLDSNGTTANNALAEIEVVVAPATRLATTDSVFWTAVGQPVAKNASGTYALTAGGMGVQVSYTVGVRYVGHDGNRSYVYIVGNTTAAQLSQVPFVGATVDPSTGYLVFTDTKIYATAAQYALLAAGVGALISASWSAIIQSTANAFDIWLMYNPATGAGYVAQWYGNDIAIYKFTNTTTFTQIGTTTAKAMDNTQLHNMEFIATYPAAGTVVLTCIFDGQIVAQATDSTSPYTQGFVAANFRVCSSPSYIDEKTIEINLGGSPSSSAIKAQANIVPSSIPGATFFVYSPTWSGGGFAAGTRDIGVNGGTIIFADGTTLAWTAQTLLRDTSGANGTWYCSVGLILASGTCMYYFSQTAPTEAQLAPFYEDGVIPVIFNQSITVAAGSNASYSVSTQRRHIS